MTTLYPPAVQTSDTFRVHHGRLVCVVDVHGTRTPFYLRRDTGEWCALGRSTPDYLREIAVDLRHLPHPDQPPICDDPALLWAWINHDARPVNVSQTNPAVPRSAA